MPARARYPGDGATNNDNDARNDNRVRGFRGFHRSPRALIAGTVAVLPSGWPMRADADADATPRAYSDADEGVTSTQCYANWPSLSVYASGLLFRPSCTRTSQSAGCLRRYIAMVLLTSLFYYDITVLRAAAWAITSPPSLQAFDSG